MHLQRLILGPQLRSPQRPGGICALLKVLMVRVLVAVLLVRGGDGGGDGSGGRALRVLGGQEQIIV